MHTREELLIHENRQLQEDYTNMQKQYDSRCQHAQILIQVSALPDSYDILQIVFPLHPLGVPFDASFPCGSL